MDSLASSLLLAVATLVTVAGCAEDGVGDPCLPEAVPSGGFVAQETYLETSSAQCRTRACLVRGLEGDPRRVVGRSCPDGGDDCVLPNDLEASIYCTCRCDGPTDAADYCPCPDGFACEALDAFSPGGDGIRGSYCVRAE